MGLLNNMLANGSSSYRAEVPQSPAPTGVSPSGGDVSLLSTVRDIGSIAGTVAAFM